MPKTPIDYTKSVVYRLIYNDITYYVGSTTNMRQRRSRHKYNTNSVKSGKYERELYKFIRNNGGWGKWDMILVQEYPLCKSSEELRKYEREHYDFYKPSLNIILPYATKEEYKEKAKVTKKEYKKHYLVENADQIKKYNETYRAEKSNVKETCACGSKFCHSGYTRHLKTQKHIKFITSKENI
jgi:GIY-YIG catalytic domain